jgi:hypothetical protein
MNNKHLGLVNISEISSQYERGKNCFYQLIICMYSWYSKKTRKAYMTGESFKKRMPITRY